MSTARIACLAVPGLALRCELAERPSLMNDAIVLSNEAGTRVVDLTEAAASHGVRRGMTLREASSACPLLDVLQPRPALVAMYADTLVEAMAAVSPLLEEEEQGPVFADLRGTESLFTNLRELRQAVFAGVPEELQPQLGVATTRFTAHMAALRAEPLKALAVNAADAAQFLEPEGVERLPLELEYIERLRLLGVETIGEFAALPRGAVEAQFGYPGGIAWLAARGEDPIPVRPRPWERERVIEHCQAEPPLVSRESVLHNLERMLIRAMNHPRARDRFVRSIRLHAETERGDLWVREQVLRELLGERERLWTLIKSLVEYAVFPGPFVLVTLELGGLTEESGRQLSLLVEQTRRREQLDEMVRHLKVRFGASPMARVVDVEPWHRLPERRRALLEYDP